MRYYILSAASTLILGCHIHSSPAYWENAGVWNNFLVPLGASTSFETTEQSSPCTAERLVRKTIVVSSESYRNGIRTLSNGRAVLDTPIEMTELRGRAYTWLILERGGYWHPVRLPQAFDSICAASVHATEPYTTIALDFCSDRDALVDTTCVMTLADEGSAFEMDCVSARAIGDSIESMEVWLSGTCTSAACSSFYTQSIVLSDAAARLGEELAFHHTSVWTFDELRRPSSYWETGMFRDLDRLSEQRYFYEYTVDNEVIIHEAPVGSHFGLALIFGHKSEQLISIDVCRETATEE